MQLEDESSSSEDDPKKDISESNEIIIDFDGPRDTNNPLNCKSISMVKFSKLTIADCWTRDMETEVDCDNHCVLFYLHLALLFNDGQLLLVRIVDGKSLTHM
jgi:hypothetical protein